MITCEVCGSIFPDDWVQPIHCNHLEPGRDYTVGRITLSIDGSQLWKELHSYSYSTPQEAEAFMADWTSRVPSFGCSCREHWSKILASIPPDFSSECAFFKWGIDAHNKVNERLGKPIFTYEEARVLYGKNCV